MSHPLTGQVRGEDPGDGQCQYISGHYRSKRWLRLWRCSMSEYINIQVNDRPPTGQTSGEDPGDGQCGPCSHQPARVCTGLSHIRI